VPSSTSDEHSSSSDSSEGHEAAAGEQANLEQDNDVDEGLQGEGVPVAVALGPDLPPAQPVRARGALQSPNLDQFLMAASLFGPPNLRKLQGSTDAASFDEWARTVSGPLLASVMSFVKLHKEADPEATTETLLALAVPAAVPQFLGEVAGGVFEQHWSAWWSSAPTTEKASVVKFVPHLIKQFREHMVRYSHRELELWRTQQLGAGQGRDQETPQDFFSRNRALLLSLMSGAGMHAA
jgi:hypothetical protein